MEQAVTRTTERKGKDGRITCHCGERIKDIDLREHLMDKHTLSDVVARLAYMIEKQPRPAQRGKGKS